VLLLLALLGGCTEPPEPLLRVGTNQWPGYELLYLARERGYFDEHHIRLVELSSNTEVLRALHNGTLQMAALTLDEAFSEVSHRTDLRIVAVLDHSNGADTLLVRPGIKTLADLKGRRIGVEPAGVGAVLLDGALQAAGLGVNDVTIVPLTLNEHEKAWRNGTVDAVVTFEPATTHLRKLGARVLFDSSRIPGRIVDVLVARADALSYCPACIHDLMWAYFRAYHYFSNYPEDAVQRMAPRLQISPQELHEAYRTIAMTGLAENRRLLGGEKPALLDAARRLGQLMVQQGLLTHEPEYGQLIDGRFLPEPRP